jgi:hypothetical protein
MREDCSWQQVKIRSTRRESDDASIAPDARKGERMKTSRLFGTVAILGTLSLLPVAPALAQQGPSGCAWKKYLYAQDAIQQGKIDTNLLNQMSALVSAQGYSLTNKVWQVCNGWLMEAKRPNGSPAIVFVDPKTQTIVDVDFSS